MIRYECDRCGVALNADNAPSGSSRTQRFIVKLEIYAAAGCVEFTDEEVADPQRELAQVLDTLAAADPDEIEDQTYRALRFDVCDACRRALLQDPLGRTRTADRQMPPGDAPSPG